MTYISVRRAPSHINTMRFTHYSFAVAVAFLAFGCAHVAEQRPQTDALRSRKDAVVVREISSVGGFTNQFQVALRVDAVRFSSPDVHRTESGAMVFVGGHPAFVPLPQISPLISGIERVCAVQAGVAPFHSYRADYSAHCGVSVSRSDGSDAMACWIDGGGGRVFTTTDGLRQFKDLLVVVEERLK